VQVIFNDAVVYWNTGDIDHLCFGHTTAASAYKASFLIMSDALMVFSISSSKVRLGIMMMSSPPGHLKKCL
jgi:hypothetical protein